MGVPLLRSEIKIRNRLHELGFQREQLLEIIDAMAAAKTGATKNDPPGAGAWSSWRMGTRRSRDVLGSDSSLGLWEKNEDGQISSVLNRQRGIRLVVANTDSGTGLDDPKQPQNSSKKGAGTDELVRQNQGSFLAELDASLPEPAVISSVGTVVNWYLCVYTNGDDVRAELSLPKAVSAGFFADFHERICLIGPGDDWRSGLSRKTGPDAESEEPEFDIPVSRK